MIGMEATSGHLLVENCECQADQESFRVRPELFFS
jgi:hypothetical protein